MSWFVCRFRRKLQATLKIRPLLGNGASLPQVQKNGDAMINDAGKQRVNRVNPVFSFWKGFDVTSGSRLRSGRNDLGKS
jgi:hypothetical protein